MTDAVHTRRVFSGSQPTGNLTLGNYLGALKRYVEMQDQDFEDTIYCVVDMHAITLWQDPAELRKATQDVAAAKFNHDFGVDFFPITEPVIDGPATRVMSLRDGTKKMSKSDPSDMSRINLTDDADTIAKKIRKAKTDPEPLPEDVKGLEGRAEARGLVDIYSGLSGLTAEQVIAEHGGSQFGPFKQALADVAVEALSPITKRMSEYLEDRAEIDKILGNGADRAAEIALSWSDLAQLAGQNSGNDH